MLGNNADAFFTTPMRTTVFRGGNTASAYRSEMPAPRGGGSSTVQVAQMPFGDETSDKITKDIADTAGALNTMFGTKVPAAVQQYLPTATPAAKPINWLLWGGIVLAAVAGIAFAVKKRA